MMERGLLYGKFHFKKLQDGSVDKTKAVCTDCQAEFSYHRSTFSLNYHMQAKHTVSSSRVRSGIWQTTSVGNNVLQSTVTPLLLAVTSNVTNYFFQLNNHN